MSNFTLGCLAVFFILGAATVPFWGTFLGPLFEAIFTFFTWQEKTANKILGIFRKK